MALDKKYSKILQDHREELINTLDPTTLLPHLSQCNLVTDAEFNELSGNYSHLSLQQRNGKLLDMITTKGTNAFDLFIAAIKKADGHLGHESIAKKLEKEKINANLQLRSQLKEEFSFKPELMQVFESLRQFSGNQLQGTSNETFTLQIVLQQLNARLGTLEVDLRSVKDTVKQMEYSESLKETRLSYSMQAIYDKLDYIQNGISVALVPSRMNEEDIEVELFPPCEPVSKCPSMTRPMSESQACENSYITTATMHKQFQTSVKKSNRPTAEAEYAEPYQVFSVTRSNSLDSLDASRDSSKTSLTSKKEVHTDPSLQKLYANILSNPLVGSPVVCRKKSTFPNQAMAYRHLETRITAYHMKKKLTDGRSGEFWEAVSSKDGSMVVVKYPVQQDKLKLKEIAALANLSHPNVAKLIGISTVKHPISLIMEHVENGNLLDYLRSNKHSLKISHQLTIAENIASGMIQLEKSNIVHCDLTAHNILIDGNLICKISSFSNAQCLQGNTKSFILPAEANMLFPLKWCAPEIFMEKRISSKSDVWAYSVVLFEIFTFGASPYPGMSNDEVRNFVTKGCVMPKPGSGFSNQVYDLMSGCFKYVPAERPAFSQVYKIVKQIQEKRKGGSTKENNTSDDYGTL